MAAREFDGEDPALPEMRQILDECKEKVTHAHDEAQRYTGPFALGEPSEEDVGRVRGILERAS